MNNNINKLPEVQFIKLFSNIFENSQFIAEALYKKRGDGFNNFEDLVKKMMNIFENTTKEQKLKILKAHPDLADKAKITSMTPDSKSEQNSAGLDQCTEDEFKEFKKLNDLYKKKFNFPFILAVKGKNKNEILDNFKKRISSDIKTEFEEAVKQVKKIASLRLLEIKNKNI
tara:strand:- start:481 stop:993 length:513 start_codon:yes stop_codon:yes gene_type:complete